MYSSAHENPVRHLASCCGTVLCRICKTHILEAIIPPPKLMHIIVL